MTLTRLGLIVLPIFLLVASGVVYLAFVQPIASSHDAAYEQMSETSGTLIKFVEDNGLYPSALIIEEMVQLEKDLWEELDGLLAPLPVGEEEYAMELEALFEKWAYPPTHPALMKIRHFEGQARERMGPGNETTASHLAKSLALSFCRVGLNDFEQLGCRLLEDAPADEVSGNLRSFEVFLEVVAGATEGVEFVEDWVLNALGGFIIRPVHARIEKTEPGLWEKNLSGFSSPPLVVELKVKVFFKAGKG